MVVCDVLQLMVTKMVRSCVICFAAGGNKLVMVTCVICSVSGDNQDGNGHVCDLLYCWR